MHTFWPIVPSAAAVRGLRFWGTTAIRRSMGAAWNRKSPSATPSIQGSRSKRIFCTSDGSRTSSPTLIFPNAAGWARLIVFIARLNAKRPAAEVFGIGLDEKTALQIGSDGVGRIVTGSAGSAWVVMPQRPAAVLTQGQPLTLKDIHILRMDENSSIDFKSRHVTRAAAETTDSIERGTPAGNSIASPIMMRAVVPPDEG